MLRPLVGSRHSFFLGLWVVVLKPESLVVELCWQVAEKQLMVQLSGRCLGSVCLFPYLHRDIHIMLGNPFSYGLVCRTRSITWLLDNYRYDCSCILDTTYFPQNWNAQKMHVVIPERTLHFWTMSLSWFFGLVL